MYFFFFKQKTAYEMRISDWSSDVCSSDLEGATEIREVAETAGIGNRCDGTARIARMQQQAMRPVEPLAKDIGREVRSFFLKQPPDIAGADPAALRNPDGIEMRVA